MGEPNLRGYEAAQREYDNRTPPDDGPSECDNCNGFGHAPVPGDPEGDHAECSVCKGFGLIDEHGEPFDPHAAEYEADAARDRARDERLTDDRDPIDNNDF